MPGEGGVSPRSRWRMTKPGEPRAEFYLYGRMRPHTTDKALKAMRRVHFAGGMNPNPYADLAPLIEQFAGVSPPPGTNWGKYLTGIGLALNAGESPLTALTNTGSNENVYTWKSMRDTPFRMITEQSIQEHPAAWWSHPQFEEVLDTKEGGVAGHPGGSSEPPGSDAVWDRLVEQADTTFWDGVADQIFATIDRL